MGEGLRLPHLLRDGMVLQRNTQARIWGWANAGQTVTVRFLGGVYSAEAPAGRWQVIVPTGNAGGPYTMEVEAGGERVTVSHILLGDVWLCSGQSNMGMPMMAVRERYPDEIEYSANDAIRQFTVAADYYFDGPREDLASGCWTAANPQSVLNFTAAGYFFAAKLYERYQVPIGLVNASLGGAPAEAFMSRDALAAYPHLFAKIEQVRDRNAVDELNRKDQAESQAWHRRVNAEDAGLHAVIPWYDPGFDASAWPHMPVPSFWEDEGLGRLNGAVWFRREVEIPSALAGKPATLFLGNIIDEDTVYVNGAPVGSLPMQYIPRKYDIPEGLLTGGRNAIAVRVVNVSGKGGFYPGKPYRLDIGGTSIDLGGDWRYAVGAKAEALPAPALVSWWPSGLYNGMIAPLLPYAIKGAVWYQGETNAQRPGEYEGLLMALIADWRGKWAQGDFPFLCVQLPNYQELNDGAEGNWPQIREAQRRVTEQVSNAALAVTVDIGEWNDVHPANKRDVGVRLALAARKVAYGDGAVVSSGPVLKTVKRDGSRAVLSFGDTGGGLVTKDGKAPGCMDIAGADQTFYRADTRMEGDCVIAWHERVPTPMYVRYAWADNPIGANLANREGLPASPFMAETTQD